MAKNISLLGANYPDVPAVVLPKTGGGSAMFVDADDVNNVENALAIVIDGDTAPKAITAGQYLFIKNHSTLATGGYHATVNIASGGAVSGSNVSADADGIANSIYSRITGIHTTVAISNGVGSISNAAIKTTSAIVIQIHRDDTSGYIWEYLWAYARCTSNGSANIYVRKSDGTLVSGNMVISAIVCN